ncbi:unnamed protein product, partial [Polarella glacialis]
SACKFAHDEEQLRQKPVFFKTRFCAELLNNGYCPMGADCKYAHDAQDMQPSLAKSKASAQGGRQHLLDKEDDSTSWTRTCSTDLDLDDAKSWVSSRSSTKEIGESWTPSRSSTKEIEEPPCSSRRSATMSTPSNPDEDEEDETLGGEMLVTLKNTFIHVTMAPLRREGQRQQARSESAPPGRISSAADPA